MTRTVVFRPQAEDELLEVQRWYEGRREGLGEEFGEARLTPSLPPTAEMSTREIFALRSPWRRHQARPPAPELRPTPTAHRGRANSLALRPRFACAPTVGTMP